MLSAIDAPSALRHTSVSQYPHASSVSHLGLGFFPWHFPCTHSRRRSKLKARASSPRIRATSCRSLRVSRGSRHTFPVLVPLLPVVSGRRRTRHNFRPNSPTVSDTSKPTSFRKAKSALHRLFAHARHSDQFLDRETPWARRSRASTNAIGGRASIRRRRRLHECGW